MTGYIYPALKGIPMLERIKAYFASLFARFQKKPDGGRGWLDLGAIVDTPVRPRLDAHEPVPDAERIVQAHEFLKPRVHPEAVTIYDIMRRLGFGLTDAQIRFAQARGVFVPPDKEPVQSIRDLSPHLHDTAVHGPWRLINGQQMTLTGSGRVRVYGAMGTELQAVNGVELSGTTAWYDADLPLTFSVRSIGGNIVAQRF
jgi:hypothetical protein